MASLVPCLGCDRYVRAVDASCPFCGTSREVELPRTSRKHVRRAAMLAVALASTPGCSDSTEPTDGGTMRVDGGGADSGEIIAPPYGIPPDDSGPPEDAGVDSGEIIAPPYGIPPDPDAGEEDGGSPADAGSAQDAATSDAGDMDAGMDAEIIAPALRNPT